MTIKRLPGQYWTSAAEAQQISADNEGRDSKVYIELHGCFDRIKGRSEWGYYSACTDEYHKLDPLTIQTLEELGYCVTLEYRPPGSGGIGGTHYRYTIKWDRVSVGTVMKALRDAE